MPAPVTVLSLLVEEMRQERIKVVDLTQALESDTPVIALPDIFAASPGFSMSQISHYDDKGPAWYWNTLTFGEHTGTHFDAPVHWVTGKDLPNNTTDTLSIGRCVGPACVVDVSEEVKHSEDFLLTRDYVLAWEAKHGRILVGPVTVAY
ncbi:MAG: cyclase family protein [Deinococcales bacterium]